jgi:hypothetical protein
MACCNRVYLRLYHGEQLSDGMGRFVLTIVSLHVVWSGVERSGVERWAPEHAARM